ncbi:hypothetical protein Tco_0451678 [Tanacetum coccineum]
MAMERARENYSTDALRSIGPHPIVTTSRYVVPTGRVKVPAGRYVVPTGKDNVIVSTGRTKVIPAGRTILVLTKAITYNSFNSPPEDHMLLFHHLEDAGISVGCQKPDWRYCMKLRHEKSKLKQKFSEFKRYLSAPTHSAFISAGSTNSKMSYPDQSHSTTFTSVSSSPVASSNVIENVLHSFVAESDPQQQITYEDFDQIWKLD